MRTRFIALVIGTAAALAAPSQARAGVAEYFESGSLVIPMDECHQFANKTIAATYRATPLCYCPTGPAAGDNGVVRAYGLIFRLLQKGVTVKVMLETDKTTLEGVDMTVQGAAEPVKLLTKTTNAESSFYTSGCRPAGATSYINYRGMPFVIPYSTVSKPNGANAALARTLMKDGSATQPGAFTASTFTNVDVHVAKIGFWAETEITLKEALKPIALNDPSDQGASAGVLQGYLVDAGLCTSIANCNAAPHGGTACAPGQILGLFDAANDFTTNNCLTVGGYKVLWSPHWEATNGSGNNRTAKIASFIDAGNAFMAECASVDTMENYSNGRFMTTGAMSLNFGSASSSSDEPWGDTTDEGYLYRDVTFPLIQKGDLTLMVDFGHTRTWRPSGGVSTYKAGTSRFVSTCKGTDWDSTLKTCKKNATATSFGNTQSNWDVLTMRRKDNDPDKGPIVYLGGHTYNSTEPGGARWVLNTLLLLQSVATEPSPRESSHAAPVLATVSGVETWVQGTMISYGAPDEAVTTFTGAASAATFKFPYRVGKLRAIQATAITGTGTQYDGFGAPLWEAGAWLAAHPGSSRTIFTHASTPTAGLVTLPAKVQLTTANAATIKPLLGPAATLTVADAQTLIGLLRAGRFDANLNRIPGLGGVDWSTSAVIEATPLIPGQTLRPTIVYVAANDGMVHAICAQASPAPCTALGQELWAYIPQPQLARLSSNTQKFEGSPRIADLFGDFDNNGSREWRTILTVASGAGDKTGSTLARPSMTALDVSDPANPIILWERTTPTSPATVDFGVTMAPAVAHMLLSNQMTPVVFVETNNGGSGGSGFFAQAYKANNGQAIWSPAFGAVFANPARGVAADGAVPATGVPGGVTLVLTAEDGMVDTILVPTLYGDLWRLDAATGHNEYGSNPLFRYGSNKHPIGSPATIYKDGGVFFAAIVTGGYVDHSGAAQWVNAGDQQKAISVKVEANPANVPLNDTSTNSDIGFSVNLGTGAYGLAQATVSGGEIFVTTSNVDVNSAAFGTGTGVLHQIDLDTAQHTTYALDFAVAASAETRANLVYVGGTNKAIKITAQNYTAAGEPIEQIAAPTVSRALWLGD